MGAQNLLFEASQIASRLSDAFDEASEVKALDVALTWHNVDRVTLEDSCPSLP